jgi:hypothetical protein
MQAVNDLPKFRCPYGTHNVTPTRTIADYFPAFRSKTQFAISNDPPATPSQ